LKISNADANKIGNNSEEGYLSPNRAPKDKISIRMINSVNATAVTPLNWLNPFLSLDIHGFTLNEEIDE
jgi:hypothetical protein